MGLNGSKEGASFATYEVVQTLAAIIITLGTAGESTVTRGLVVTDVITK